MYITKVKALELTPEVHHKKMYIFLNSASFLPAGEI